VSPSILEAGFLSPDNESFIDEYRRKYRDWFDLIYRVNCYGQTIMADAELKVTEKGAADPKLIALLLLVRTLSNYQAVVLLAERGMVVEARTLARSCYENVYCMAALQQDGEAFVKRMVDDDAVSRKKMANALLRRAGALEQAGAGAAERLEGNVANIDARAPDAVRLVLEQAAEKAGVGDLYLFYRQLSWDSAHPTVQALSRYFSGDRHQLWWGPETKGDEIADTLSITLAAVFGVFTIARDMLLGGSEPDLETLWREYKELVTR
jgi:hypothetical protein